MKNYLLVFGLLLMGVVLHAQKTVNYSLLTDHQDPIDIRGFGGPFVFFSGNETEFTVFAGGGGAVLLNRNYYFGGFGVSALGGMNPDGYNDPAEYKNYLDLGGIWTGWVFMPHDVFHPVLDLKAGWGNFAIHDLAADEYMNLGVYFVQPSFQIEANVSRFIQIDIGVHYRYVSPLDLYAYKTASLSGVGAGITFKFGWFGQR